MNNLSLSELTVDNIGQWPPLVKGAAIVLSGLLLVFAGYWLFVKGHFETYASLQSQEVTLREEFERKQQEAVHLVAYRNQMVMMEERFGAMLKQLPTQNEMPGLLEDISKTGIASGLSFESFTPQPEVPYDFYIELPIKMVVVGNYHQLAVFLSRVALMSRIVTLHDLEIRLTPPAKGAPPPNPLEEKKTGDQLTMELTAKIYRYRSQ